jgi:hypothetical protein
MGAVEKEWKIKSPSVVSFSGGRTSAFMLWRILQACGGALPRDVHCVFANTGKEREETLVFVDRCAKAWGVDVVWVEYRDRPENWARVTFDTAARNGEPFTALVNRRGMLPNPVARFCTQELKIRVMKRWMVASGHKPKSGRGVSGGAPYWTNYVGIRADEPRRLSRGSPRGELYDVEHPLAAWGTTQKDVLGFWAGQPFDLGLRSWEGNCDMCFLKGYGKLLRIAQENPDAVRWWAQAEAEARSSKPQGARFRVDRPPYRELLRIVQSEPGLPGVFDENHGAVVDCFCSEDMVTP